MDNTLTVEKVFHGRLLRVPDYQRGYAWEAKNWTAFLDDLDLLPQLLAALPDWTPDRIRTRESQLLAWAIGRWAVPDAAVEEEVVEDEVIDDELELA